MSNKYSSSLKISWVSVVVNLLLALIKFVIGIASNSISILTDAAHSLSDLVTTAVVIVSIYLSRKPADEKHPFGHGRAEDVGGLILSVALAFVGIGFLKSSLTRLVVPEEVSVNSLFVIIVLATGFCKFVLGLATQIIAVRNKSKILKTDAFHHYSDAITSLSVGVGLFLFLIKDKFVYIDSLLGIFMALLIIVWSFRSGKEFADNLIGRKVSPEFYDKVNRVACSTERVEGVHAIQVHSYGDVKIISLHIELNPLLSLVQAHNVADSIEKSIEGQGLGKCIVHVDLKKHRIKGGKDEA